MSITLSQAIEGFWLAAKVRRLSVHTIADYSVTLRKFQAFLNAEMPLASINPEHIQHFLAAQNVSNKTLMNYHTGLSALWTWAKDEQLVVDNVVRDVTPPRPEKRAIEPFSEADVWAMLSVLGHSRRYTPKRARCVWAQGAARPGHTSYHAWLRAATLPGGGPDV